MILVRKQYTIFLVLRFHNSQNFTKVSCYHLTLTVENFKYRESNEIRTYDACWTIPPDDTMPKSQSNLIRLNHIVWKYLSQPKF